MRFYRSLGILFILLSHCSGENELDATVGSVTDEMYLEPGGVSDVKSRGDFNAKEDDLGRAIGFDCDIREALRQGKYTRLESERDVFRFEANLDRLLEQKQYDTLLSESSKVTLFSFPIHPYQAVSHLLKRYNHYASAVEMVGGSQTDPDRTQGYYEKAIAAFESGTRQRIDSFVDESEPLQALHTINRYLVYDSVVKICTILMEIHANWISTWSDRDDVKALKERVIKQSRLVKWRVGVRESHFQLQRDILKLNIVHNPQLGGVYSRIKEKIGDEKVGMHDLYLDSAFMISNDLVKTISNNKSVRQQISGPIVQPALRRLWIDKANAIALELQSEGDADRYRRTQERKNLVASLSENTNAVGHSLDKVIDARRIGPRYAKFIQQKQQLAARQGLSQTEPVLLGFTNSTSQSFVVQIQLNHSALDVMDGQHNEEKVFELLSMTEALILTHLASQDAAVKTLSRADQLIKIYDLYLDTIRSANDQLCRLAKERVAQMVLESDTSGLSDRLELLRHLDTRKNGNLSFGTRALIAAVKNVNGDHREWLEIEADVQKVAAAANKKKRDKDLKVKETLKQTIEAERARTVAETEMAQQDAQHLAEQRARSAQVELQIARNNASAVAAPGVEVATDRDNKAAQLRRHEANEALRRANVKQREDDALEDQNDTKDEKQRDEHPARLDLRRAGTHKVRDLFILKGAPRNVDDEIESDSWSFTRAELEGYFRALGCSVVEGKGVHKKVALPKGTTISFGDNVITVFNDFGGALPLPSWDDKFVPYYLRPQILLARTRLVAFKQSIPSPPPQLAQ